MAPERVLELTDVYYGSLHQQDLMKPAPMFAVKDDDLTLMGFPYRLVAFGAQDKIKWETGTRNTKFGEVEMSCEGMLYLEGDFTNIVIDPETGERVF